MAHLTAQNFSMYSGDDFVLKITVTDSTTGLAMNLTGLVAAVWKAAWQVIGTAVVSKTLGAGIAVTDAVNGKLEITLAPADTSALVGAYYHELQIVSSSNKKTTVMQGTITIDPDLVTE